jgi:hypothetical protein
MEKIEQQKVTVVRESGITPLVGTQMPTEHVHVDNLNQHAVALGLAGWDELCVGCGYPNDWCRCFGG